MLQRPLIFLFTVLSIVSGSNLYARALDFNLSGESAQVKYTTLMGATNYGRTEVGFGFLYHEDKNYLGEIGLLVIDEAGSKSPGLEVGVGTKLYYAQADKPDIRASAIGLGGQLRYRHAAAPRIVYSATLFYAPGIVSFQDADQMYEFGATIEYELIPTANAYVGYRLIETEIKNRDDVEIDDNFIVGLRFKF
ncbi:MAG: YfaZ family protein [Gammaproteobacteria bacterium]|nr:YfaZ family protein [Gammaproteobacteria bacterium]